MSITYRNYETFGGFSTYVDPSPTPGPSDSDFKVTRLTSTEFNLSVNFQGINVTLNYIGQFDLSGITIPINTLEDINNAQGASKGVIESLLFSINGKNAAFITTDSPLPVDEFSVILDATDLAAMKRVLAGNDTYITSSTSEDSNTYYLYGGNDTLHHNHSVLKYSDVFVGGDGLDTAIIPGKASNYSVVASKSVWDQVKQVGNLSGFVVTDSTKKINTLQVSEVERLKFMDGNVALDIGPSQNAGSLYMLYKAAFNRAPDEGGMGYWLAQVDGGKNLVNDIAAGFVKAPEFVAKYGTNPTNAFYVDQLYLNVLGRPGEAGGVAYWNQELNSGARSKAEVLVQFATLPEGAALVANLIANGIPYQEWVG